MKKNYLGLFIAAILMCQSLFAATFVDAQSPLPKEVELLAALGILEGDDRGDFRLKDTITRAEYTMLILRMMGYRTLTDQERESGFSDVRADHWASGAIGIASDLDLVSGVGNNTFEPDRTVNRMEAIKIMVCALGYGALAERDGGYPSGYSKRATGMGLFKGLLTTEEFLRGEACTLIKNALTVDIMDGMGTVVSGDDVLTRYLNLTVMSGFVTGTEGVGERTIRKGYIEISGKLYKLQQPPTEELFGCEVRFYLHEEEEIYHMVVLEDESRLTVWAADIMDTTTLSAFHYREENREWSKQLSDNLMIYYNGEKVTSKYRKDILLRPDSGHVILCDKEKDGFYDLAIVTSYRTMVVNYVSHDTIYDVYGKHLTIRSAEIKVFMEGQEIELETLEKGHVISVARSISGSKIQIQASAEMLVGRILQTETTGGKWRYLFEKENGETLYLEAAKSYAEAVASGLARQILVPDRRMVLVALNPFGEIADGWLREESDALQYGYLIGTAIDLQEGLTLKILTADNRFTVIPLPQSKRIGFGRVEGGTYAQSNEAAEFIFHALGGNHVNRQIIQYRLEDEGRLTQLYLADKSKNINALSEDVPRHFATYRQGVLDQKYFLDDKTVVFSMPHDDIYEDVMAAGRNSNFFSEGQSRYCTLYDIEDARVGAVVVHEAVAIKYDAPENGYEKIIRYGSSPVLFINDSSRKMAEDGQHYMSLEGYKDGQEISLPVSDALSQNAESSTKLSPGAVIQYETNSFKKSMAKSSDEAEQLIVFEKIFDFKDHNSSGILWNHDIIIESNPDILTIWGELKAVDPAYCTIEVRNGATTEAYVMSILNNSLFMKYDSGREEFIPITLQEMVPGQQVYICRQSNKQDIVVY